MTAPEEPRLSVTLIARDEEDRLPGALASVAFADAQRHRGCRVDRPRNAPDPRAQGTLTATTA